MTFSSKDLKFGEYNAGTQTSKSTRFFAPSVVALPHVSVVN